MQTIIDGIRSVYAMLAVFPFLPFFVIWIVFYFIYRDKRRAIKPAMDFTVVLLIGSVSILFEQVFSTSYGKFIVLLLFLLSFGILGNLQNRLRGRIDLKKLARVIWRLGFLGLSVAYIVLGLISFGRYIYSS